MTVREHIIDTLRTSDRPLSQIEIARQANLVASSVRRECQKLEREGIIRIYSYNNSHPVFELTGVTSQWHVWHEVPEVSELV